MCVASEKEDRSEISDGNNGTAGGDIVEVSRAPLSITQLLYSLMSREDEIICSLQDANLDRIVMECSKIRVIPEIVEESFKFLALDPVTVINPIKIKILSGAYI